MAIARALSTHPTLILADEPTGNLDSETSEEIMGLFRELNEQGMTIIMVSAARNSGIAATGAPLVAFLDSDDLWLPEKLGAQVHFFQQQHNLEVIEQLFAAIFTRGHCLLMAAIQSEAERPMQRVM